MSQRRRRLPAPAPTAVVLAALAVASCGSGGPALAPSPGEMEGDVLVSAAASLTDAFEDLEAAFEAAHPRVDVILNLGGSSALREQILGGAPADVFASADVANMQQVAAAGLLAGEPVVFAANAMRIAVPRGNPGNVRSLDDLADEDLLVGLCAETVPCGRLARELLAAAGVDAAIDTAEPDVRSLMTKVAAGELDAGIVYVTDLAAARGSVEGIDIANAADELTEYAIAVLDAAPHPDGAAAFVALVQSDRGRAVLSRHGFVLP